jgi:hypothetical protein
MTALSVAVSPRPAAVVEFADRRDLYVGRAPAFALFEGEMVVHVYAVLSDSAFNIDLCLNCAAV